MFGNGSNIRIIKALVFVGVITKKVYSKHTLPLKKCKNCEGIKDIGRRYMDYGNAGGGHYNGIYRSFLVRDRFGETQIVSISIFGTTSDLNDEKRGSYTSLVLAIDRFKTSHKYLPYSCSFSVLYPPVE